MGRKQPSIYISLILRGFNVRLLCMIDSEQKPSPSLLRRLTAMLYDSLLVVALVGVVNALALAVVAQLTEGKEQILGPPIVQALTILTVVGFFSLFWVKTGQTLGMQAWRIKVVDFQGEAPTTTKAVVRCFGACLSAACLGLGYLWCLVDHHKRYWHDYISRTELILLPKQEKKNAG